MNSNVMQFPIIQCATLYSLGKTLSADRLQVNSFTDIIELRW